MRTCAVILAGGKGTRLRHISQKTPKPMVKIGPLPVLEHQIRLLKEYGINRITLVTGYLSEVIEQYFADGSRFGVTLDYFREQTPLGTTGGIKRLQHILTDDFLVFYGDVMVNMDLARLVRFHRAKTAAATLVVHPNDHPCDSDLVELDGQDRIVAFYPKPHPPHRYFRNLVLAGVYVLSPAILRHLPKQQAADFGRDIFPKVVSTERLYGYRTAEYIKDIGTPDRLRQVRADYRKGKIAALRTDTKRPAIFLDRDGVINQYVGLVRTPADFRLLGRAASAIKKINSSRYLAIVVTNQPVVARGLCSLEQLEEIHRKMDTLLGSQGAKLDALYFCPHHPDIGFAGENPAYKIKCRCRKPDFGMLKKAQQDFNINLGNSWLIGDSERDILCAKNAGLTSIGLLTGAGCKDCADTRPDYFFADLYEAVNFILAEPCRGVRFTFGSNLTADMVVKVK